jgi:hypothetical protein
MSHFKLNGRGCNDLSYFKSNQMKSQNERILQHLKKGKKITPLDALEKFGCFRLAARISDLRKDGHLISTENLTKDGKTFASYKYIKA